MQNFFDTLSEAVGHLGKDVFSLAPVVGVILVLVIINRALGRQTRQTSGLRFRNQLVTAALTFVGILVIIVVLPVHTDVRGQLLTLVGIIISVTISLSSSTFLGNAMAGIMLKSVRNFHSGDFIQVGDHFGRVTERGLFHTEIQTASRDLTTLPNLYLATTPMTVTRSSGTIVDATVSLGFDLPHARIEILLLDAAREAELTEPFVQVLELGDFSVTYRVAGLLTDTKRLLTFRSRLRVAMLDALHGGGVEIVSPNFMNMRDYDPGHHFAPPAPSAPTPTEANAPVEVVFDKAEEAQTLSELRKSLAELVARDEELRKEAKTNRDDDAKKKYNADRERLAARIDRLQQEVAAAEAKEKAMDD